LNEFTGRKEEKKKKKKKSDLLDCCDHEKMHSRAPNIANRNY
jgi:hypothetical protein